MACLKKVSTIRLLKHRAKFSSVLVNNAKAVAGKLDASFCILLDEMRLDDTAGLLIWASFSME